MSYHDEDQNACKRCDCYIPDHRRYCTECQRQMDDDKADQEIER